MSFMECFVLIDNGFSFSTIVAKSRHLRQLWKLRGNLLRGNTQIPLQNQDLAH